MEIKLYLFKRCVETQAEELKSIFPKIHDEIMQPDVQASGFPYETESTVWNRRYNRICRVAELYQHFISINRQGNLFSPTTYQVFSQHTNIGELDEFVNRHKNDSPTTLPLHKIIDASPVNGDLMITEKLKKFALSKDVKTEISYELDLNKELEKYELFESRKF